MNTARDKAVLAALEHITDVLAILEYALRHHVPLNCRNAIDENFDALRKNIEEIRDAIED